MPLLVKTYLKDIPGKGISLIAGEDIDGGKVMYKDDLNFDRLIPKSQVDTMPDAQKEFIERYCAYWKKFDSYYLCADNARFWNHSISANTKYNPEIGEVITLRFIHKDEELTSDYTEFDDYSKEGDFGFEIL